MKKTNDLERARWALNQAHLSREQADLIPEACFAVGAVLGILLGLSLNHFFKIWVWAWIPAGLTLGAIAMIVGAAVIADEVI